MRKSGRLHGVRLAVGLAALFVLAILGREMYGSAHAGSLVARLRSASIAQVPDIVREIGRYRRWADPQLREAAAAAPDGSGEQLRLELALLPIDAGQRDAIYRRLLSAPPDEVAVLRDALAPQKDALLEPLWSVMQQPGPSAASQRLRAASALAAYAPNDARWAGVQARIADDFVMAPPVYLQTWLGALRPVSDKLIPPLSAVFRDPQRSETERTLATDILVDYAGDRPKILAGLLLDADRQQFLTVFARLKLAAESVAPLFTLEVVKQLAADASNADKETQAGHTANAAAALVLFQQTDAVWPLLRASPDPRVRSYLIDRLGSLGCDPKTILDRLDNETDVTARRALLLSLGEFSDTAWSADDRNKALSKIQANYRAASDPGLRAAAEWLLRRAGQAAWLQQTDAATESSARAEQFKKLIADFAKPVIGDAPQWFLNSQGAMMVAVHGPVEFLMGAPDTEFGREDDERQHRRRIGRSFAVASKPVSVDQFRIFDSGYKLSAKQASSGDCPAVNVTWYQTASYCNWLSKQEGIAADQWCYETDTQNNIVKMKDKYLGLAGYRLPTEAELEYVTRASTLTARCFGEADRLLPKYAWYSDDSHDHTWPLAKLKPNDFGLFDTLGNAYGWCQDTYEQYPVTKAGEAVADVEGKLPIDPTAARTLRGGSFNDQGSVIRSAYRHIDVPTYKSSYLGFRIARTIGE